MSDDKAPQLQEEEVQKRFMRLPILLVLGVNAVAMYLDVMPKGMIGGMCFLLPLALILEGIGKRIPILKSYLGAPPCCSSSWVPVWFTEASFQQQL